MNATHTIDQVTDLLWVAHNLERAADRVINICEGVVFTVTGKAVGKISRPKSSALTPSRVEGQGARW